MMLWNIIKIFGQTVNDVMEYDKIFGLDVNDVMEYDKNIWPRLLMMLWNMIKIFGPDVSYGI